jgi:hypothetical protein
MIRITTETIPTQMVYGHSVRDRTTLQFISDSVNPQASTTEQNLPIAIWPWPAFPGPATQDVAPVDSCPERFNLLCRNSHRLWRPSPIDSTRAKSFVLFVPIADSSPPHAAARRVVPARAGAGRVASRGRLVVKVEEPTAWLDAMRAKPEALATRVLPPAPIAL